MRTVSRIVRVFPGIGFGLWSVLPALVLSWMITPSAKSQWIVDRAIGTDPPSSLSTFTRVRILDEDGPGPQASALFACGYFDVAHGVYSPRIVKWDGYRWTGFGQGLGSSFPEATYDACVFDSDGAGPGAARLYVVGNFLPGNGGIPAGSLAWWDGIRWDTIAVGTSRIVTQALSFDSDGDGPAIPLLIVGGSAVTSAGLDLEGNALVGWDGERWVDLNPPFPVSGANSGTVIKWMLEWDHDDSSATPPVLAIGAFARPPGEVFRSILALWNGESWATIGMPEVGGPEGLFTGSMDAAIVSPGIPGFPRNELLIAAHVIFAYGAEGWRSIGQGPVPHRLTSVDAIQFLDLDGNGPETASLVAFGVICDGTACTFPKVLVRWNGTSWEELPRFGAVASVFSLQEFDIDGAGPQSPLIVAGGQFGDSAAGPNFPFATYGPVAFPDDCRSDVSRDGFVGMADITIILASWGLRDPTIDVSGDGVVNLQDVSLVLVQWGASCG